MPGLERLVIRMDERFKTITGSTALVPSATEVLWRCERCGREVISCIPIIAAWCSCVGRIARDGKCMVRVRLSKVEAGTRKTSTGFDQGFYSRLEPTEASESPQAVSEGNHPTGRVLTSLRAIV